MSATNISDVLTRVSAIEQQLAQLQSGAMLDALTGASSPTSSSSSASTSSNGDFANALAQASSTDTATSPSSSVTGAEASLLADLLGGSAAQTGGVAVGGDASATAAATLPAGASSLLTSDQQQFASTLSAETGLSPSVVSAWVLAEESGGAAQTRQAAGNNDWLNIGYTDSATYGASDSVWSDPVTAAQATASWLKGQDSIPGYGTASSGVQAILQTVGQTPAQQIQAIQGSGWASSGYPDLSDLYNQVTTG